MLVLITCMHMHTHDTHCTTHRPADTPNSLSLLRQFRWLGHWGDRGLLQSRGRDSNLIVSVFNVLAGLFARSPIRIAPLCGAYAHNGTPPRHNHSEDHIGTQVGWGGLQGVWRSWGRATGHCAQRGTGTDDTRTQCNHSGPGFCSWWTGCSPRWPPAPQRMRVKLRCWIAASARSWLCEQQGATRVRSGPNADAPGQGPRCSFSPRWRSFVWLFRIFAVPPAEHSPSERAGPASTCRLGAACQG